MRRDRGAVGGEGYGDSTAAFVNGAQGVEDEVADAVEDGRTMVLLHR